MKLKPRVNNLEYVPPEAAIVRTTSPADDQVYQVDDMLKKQNSYNADYD